MLQKSVLVIIAIEYNLHAKYLKFPRKLFRNFFQCRTKNEKIMNTKYSNIVKVSHKHKKKIWIIRMLWRHPSWAHTINRFNRVMICVGCKNVTSTVLSPCRVSVWFMNTNSGLTANKLSKLYTIWYSIYIYVYKHKSCFYLLFIECCIRIKL